MSAAQFTPGPWQAFKDRHNESYVIDTALGRASTNVTVIADDIRGEQRHGNANLIAAAPELYEALSVLSFHSNGWHAGDRLSDTQAHQLRLAAIAAEAALAKARGES